MMPQRPQFISPQNSKKFPKNQNSKFITNQQQQKPSFSSLPLPQYQHQQQLPPHSIPSSSSSNSKSVGSPFVIFIRGLPHSATETDILRFFVGTTPCRIMPGGVHMMRDKAGTAYVELMAQQDVAAAVTRHKHMMGKRYLEIFVSNQGDLQKGLQVRNNTNNHGNSNNNMGMMKRNNLLVPPPRGNNSNNINAVPGGWMPQQQQLHLPRPSVPTSSNSTTSSSIFTARNVGQNNDEVKHQNEEETKTSTSIPQLSATAMMMNMQ